MKLRIFAALVSLFSHLTIKNQFKLFCLCSDNQQITIDVFYRTQDEIPKFFTYEDVYDFLFGIFTNFEIEDFKILENIIIEAKKNIKHSKYALLSYISRELLKMHFVSAIDSEIDKRDGDDKINDCDKESYDKTIEADNIPTSEETRQFIVNKNYEIINNLTMDGISEPIDIEESVNRSETECRGLSSENENEVLSNLQMKRCFLRFIKNLFIKNSIINDIDKLSHPFDNKILKTIIDIIVGGFSHKKAAQEELVHSWNLLFKKIVKNNLCDILKISNYMIYHDMYAISYNVGKFKESKAVGKLKFSSIKNINDTIKNILSKNKSEYIINLYICLDFEYTLGKIRSLSTLHSMDRKAFEYFVVEYFNDIGNKVEALLCCRYFKNIKVQFCKNSYDCELKSNLINLEDASSGGRRMFFFNIIHETLKLIEEVPIIQ